MTPAAGITCRALQPSLTGADARCGRRRRLPCAIFGSRPCCRCHQVATCIEATICKDARAAARAGLQVLPGGRPRPL